MSEIANYLSGKTLLVTGTTGFLAKGIIEKIFRHAPDIERMYLLIRPKRLRDGSTLSAEERVEKEIYPSAALARLRAVYGDRFPGVFRDRVMAVAGDLTLDHLGFDPEVYQQLAQEVQIVINSAASVSFDEEIDYALQLNSLGAKRVMEFAKTCRNAVLIHVSTAYVSGQRTGRIPELPPTPDRSIAQEIGLSQRPFLLDEEIRDILAVSRHIHEQSQSPAQQKVFRRVALRQNPKPSQRWLDSQMETFRKRWLKQALIDEGIRRAKAWGWHDSYTMTKSMGEQLIVKGHGDLPVTIVRPSIVEGSLVDPEPGWVEDLKVADTLINAISRGRLPDFPANPDITLDVTPVDIVVNTVLAALPRAAREGGIQVFHASTGDRNPIKIGDLFDLVYDYFRRNPRQDRQGQPIPVQRWRFPTLKQFHRRYRIRYVIPLDMAQWVLDRLSWLPATNLWRQRVTVLRAAISRMLYYADIYSPYTTLDCTFETNRTQRLHNSLDAGDQAVFNCDVTRIRWPEYIQEIHIPGLKRHVLKEGDEREEDAEAEVTVQSGFTASEEQALPHLNTITDILEKSAEMYGTKTALEMKQDGVWVRYTYRETHALAGHMGWSWRQQGLHPGDRVIIYAENKPAWGIAYFAAMAAGAAIVPVDHHASPQEVRAVVRFTEARAVLCSEDGHAALLGNHALRSNRKVPEGPSTQHEEKRSSNIFKEVYFWNIDNYGLPFGEAKRITSPVMEDEEPPAWAPAAPDSVASILFAGDMGDDLRGVALTHRNFVSNLLALADVLRAYRTDHFLSILPLNQAFEFTGGFLMPFYAGATITYTDTLNARVLIDLIEETKTTCLLATPRIFKLLLERLRRIGEEAGTPQAHALIGRIRLLVSGGAALDADLYEAYRKLGLTIHEGYGLTEAAPVLTVNPMGMSKPASVGRPLPGIDLRIENPDDRGCGEIVARGPNVMAGYYRNPEATAEYLRDGWLYTGDVGRMDEEGYLYITGRVRDMIGTDG